MDMNRLTQKSQEALAQAQNIAITHGHNEVDGEHLLLALLEQSEGLVPRLMHKMDVPVRELTDAVKEELSRRPRVSGPGIEPGKIAISQRLFKALIEAEKEARRLRDEYVSVEHILLALINEGSGSGASRVPSHQHAARRVTASCRCAAGGSAASSGTATAPALSRPRNISSQLMPLGRAKTTARPFTASGSRTWTSRQADARSSR